MKRATIFLLLLLDACALPPPRPELAACLARMEGHAASLRPAFAALGYRPEVQLRLDEEMTDVTGFRKSADVLGDASPGGGIRLRPSRVCADAVLARAVVAHEMAHVALQHRGVAGSGVTLLWEKPAPQEVEANQLAHAVLQRAGSHAAATLVGCWLGRCEAVARPVGAPRRP